MKRAEDFIIYPASSSNSGKAIIQSDHRIAEIDLATGTGTLSKYRSGGAHFVDLSGMFGSMPCQLDAADLDFLNQSQPHQGDRLAPGLVAG